MLRQMNRMNIFEATKANNYALVLAYLTEFENDPNERDDNGLTCLHYCATYGHLETAKVLLSYGADFEIKDLVSGWTALHRSIYFQHVQLTLLFIQLGARFDVQNYSGDSVDMYGKTFAGKSSDVARVDSKLLDNEGKSPFELLSLLLKTNLRLGTRSAEIRSLEGVNRGVIMSFGKADFTLGVPLPKSSEISRSKRIDSLLGENIQDFSTAKYHVLAMTQQGHVYSWGNGKSGRLGHGNENSQPEPALITSLLKHRVLQVCASEGHSLVVTDQNVVLSWGSDRFGQLGHGGQHDANRWIASPKRIDYLKKECVVGIAAGDHHSLCYTSDGKVFAWGSNKNGQLGINPAELSSGATGVHGTPFPKRVTLPFVTVNSRTRFSTSITYEIKQIVAANQSSLLLCRTSNDTMEARWRSDTTSEVYQWGDNTSMIRKVYFNTRSFTKRSKSNEFGANESFVLTASDRNVAMDPMNIIQIAAGKNHFAALSYLGFVYTWGIGSEQLGHSTDGTIKSEPSKSLSCPSIVEGLLPENGGGKIVAISAAGNRTCAVTDEGDLFSWGTTNDKGVLSASPAINYQPVPKKVAGIKRAVKVGAGEDYTLVLLAISTPPLPDFHASIPSLVKPPPAVVEDYQYGDDLYYTSGDHSKTLTVSSSSMTTEIPSLFNLCAKELCRAVNIKNVLNGLVFAQRYQSSPLIEYCTEYIRRNLDAIIIQTKPLDLEKIMEELTDFRSLLKQRKQSFAEESMNHPSVAVNRYRKESKDVVSGTPGSAAMVRRQSSTSFENPLRRSSSVDMAKDVTKVIPMVNMKLTEKKDYQEITTSQEMMKAIRAVKKKLQSIEQIEERLRTESYQPSKEQQEKLSKKVELQIELAKMEQYLIRLVNREKLALSEISPETSTANASIEKVEVETEPLKGEEKIGKPKNSNRKKKTVYVPLDLSVASSLPPSISASNPVNSNVPIDATTNQSLPAKAGPPMTFSQWTSMFPSSTTNNNNTNSSSCPSTSTPSPVKSGEDHSGKKVSLSTVFAGGRTVLSPPVSNPVIANPPVAAINRVSGGGGITVGNNKTVLSSPGAPGSGGSGGFSLADFMTPKGKKSGNTSTNNSGTGSTRVDLSSGPPKEPSLTNVWGRSPATPTSQATPNTPTTPVVSTTTPKKSLLEIQQEEEHLRLNSSLPALKGNQIPWKIDRQLRGESLQELMTKEMIAKQENEEILREVQAFEEREKRNRSQTTPSEGKKKGKSSQSRGKGGSSKDSTTSNVPLVPDNPRSSRRKGPPGQVSSPRPNGEVTLPVSH